VAGGRGISQDDAKPTNRRGRYEHSGEEKTWNSGSDGQESEPSKHGPEQICTLARARGRQGTRYKPKKTPVQTQALGRCVTNTVGDEAAGAKPRHDGKTPPPRGTLLATQGGMGVQPGRRGEEAKTGAGEEGCKEMENWEHMGYSKPDAGQPTGEARNDGGLPLPTSLCLS